ncbi:hypothetical protein NE237_013677 [Protea cynaroides]|uniref:peptidylprolyl isomerase n=1 Tax=Protea cynaroides TaxID=273540 RepID=A0A9Q0H0D7_9MAGN|nr:hypothetical protein NE237_013677 [Protea cynaroides]
MASMAMTIPSKSEVPKINFRSIRSLAVTSWKTTSINFCNAKHDSYSRWLLIHMRGFRHLSEPIYAVGSGLESSIVDPKDTEITLKNARVFVESHDDAKMQVRVRLTGEETQKVFDEVLTNLSRTAPPIPGFRRQKGGKTSKVPKSFLLQMLGEERVTKFVIQEIISSTLTDYVEKENLTVKKKLNTTQTAEELESIFSPGNEFVFNATLELEK